MKQHLRGNDFQEYETLRLLHQRWTLNQTQSKGRVAYSMRPCRPPLTAFPRRRHLSACDNQTFASSKFSMYTDGHRRAPDAGGPPSTSTASRVATCNCRLPRLCVIQLHNGHVKGSRQYTRFWHSDSSSSLYLPYCPSCFRPLS